MRLGAGAGEESEISGPGNKSHPPVRTKHRDPTRPHAQPAQSKFYGQFAGKRKITKKKYSTKFSEVPVAQKFSEALGGPELSKTKFSENIFSPNFTRSSRNGGGGLFHRPGAGQKQIQNVRRQKIMSLDGVGIIT